MFLIEKSNELDAGQAALLGGALLVAAVVHRLVFAILSRIAGRTDTPVDGVIVDQVRSVADYVAELIAEWIPNLRAT